nr:unnamed protein product [Callosobruchus analis]
MPPINRSNVPADSTDVYYRRSIFIPWLDSFLANISEIFCKHRDILKGFMFLIPSGRLPSEVEKEQFLNIAKYYKEDLDCNNFISLTSEYDRFILLRIFATLPTSTSTAERSFSSLRRIKSYLRNTMGENRLNGLAHLNIHREIVVDPNDAISVLQRRGVRRLNFDL